MERGLSLVSRLHLKLRTLADCPIPVEAFPTSPLLKDEAEWDPFREDLFLFKRFPNPTRFANLHPYPKKVIRIPMLMNVASNVFPMFAFDDFLFSNAHILDLNRGF